MSLIFLASSFRKSLICGFIIVFISFHAVSFVSAQEGCGHHGGGKKRAAEDKRRDYEGRGEERTSEVGCYVVRCWVGRGRVTVG